MDDINFTIFENPLIIKYCGDGKLFHEDFSLDVEFRYYLVNEKAIFFCKSSTFLPFQYKLHLREKDWKLEGKIQDNRNFHVSHLFPIRYDGKNHFEFVQEGDVIIGDIDSSKTTDSINYHAFNLFLNDFDFEYDGFKIEIQSQSCFEHQLISKFWNIPQIGATIKLSKKDEPNESFEKLINLILRLLELALGKSLSIPVRDLEKNSHQTTLISNARPTDRKIQRIIEEDDVCQFLKSTLPHFKNDFDRKYIELRTLLEYINSTDNGYLDDRVLSIIQAYEILELRYKLNIDLPEELLELKKNLKKAISEWHSRNPQFDKGMVSQRVCDSLSWDKTSSKLEMLLDSFNLNRRMLDVDFKSLVKWRHKVAHEGMLKSENNDEVADKLLDAQLAIRLLILKMVGYSGKVLPNKGPDSRKIVSDFFLD